MTRPVFVIDGLHIPARNQQEAQRKYARMATLEPALSQGDLRQQLDFLGHQPPATMSALAPIVATPGSRLVRYFSTRPTTQPNIFVPIGPFPELSDPDELSDNTSHLHWHNARVIFHGLAEAMPKETLRKLTAMLVDRFLANVDDLGTKEARDDAARQIA